MFLIEVTIGTYKAYKPLYICILLNTKIHEGNFQITVCYGAFVINSTLLKEMSCLYLIFP